MSPDLYHEAFMFMGDKAFAYYFPALEHFVYSLPNLTSEDDERENPHGWIVAKSIECHFERQDNHCVLHLAGRVIELAKFVQANIQRFEPDLYGYGSEIHQGSSHRRP